MKSIMWKCLILFGIGVVLIGGYIPGQVTADTLEIDWKLINADAGDTLAWSPDGKQLAFGNALGNQLSIFNFQKQAVEKQIAFSETSISRSMLTLNAVWSLDGKHIAVSREGVAYVIDAQNWAIVQTYKEISHYFSDVRWIDDSSRIAALDNFGFIYTFDIVTGKEVNVINLDLPPESSVGPFDWNSQNGLFAVLIHWINVDGINPIGFYDQDGNFIMDYANPDDNGNLKMDCVAASDSTQNIYSIVWSFDGKKLSVGAKYGLTICSLERGHKINAQTIDNDSTSITAWSPDDRWLVSTNTFDPACWIKVFDATQDFALKSTFQGQLCGIESLSWSPDGRYIAAGSPVELWIGTVKPS